MKRPVVIGIAVVACLGVVWIAFMSCINTKTSTLDVHVAGQVDRVVFYETSRPDNPVASIFTEGQDANISISLPNTARFSLLAQSQPAQYYFVATQGQQSQTSRTVCCANGSSKRGTLTIRGLNDWEQSWQR